jgi:hypothetical protein
MHRHLSTSIATMVALMAARRATSGGDGTPTTFSQDQIARIDAYLSDDEPAVSATPHEAARRSVSGGLGP